MVPLVPQMMHSLHTHPVSNLDIDWNLSSCACVLQSILFLSMSLFFYIAAGGGGMFLNNVSCREVPWLTLYCKCYNFGKVLTCFTTNTHKPTSLLHECWAGRLVGIKVMANEQQTPEMHRGRSIADHCWLAVRFWDQCEQISSAHCLRLNFKQV